MTKREKGFDDKNNETAYLPAKARSLPVNTMAPTSGSASKPSAAEHMSFISPILSAFSAYPWKARQNEGWGRSTDGDPNRRTCGSRYRVEGPKHSQEGQGRSVLGKVPDVTPRHSRHQIWSERYMTVDVRLTLCRCSVHAGGEPYSTQRGTIVACVVLLDQVT